MKKSTIKQPVDSKTFCILPWIHVNASVSGIYRPCCNSLARFENRDDVRSINEALHGPEMEEIRQAMVNGEQHEACKVCYDRDNIDAYSVRRAYTEEKFRHFVDANATPALKYLDMRFDNQCNLACRMCDPASSNRVEDAINWFTDQDKPLPYHWDTFTSKRDNDLIRRRAVMRRDYVIEQLSTIRSLKVTGGEPFMSGEFIEVLDKAIETGDAEHIKLQITTNGTKFTKKILDRLEPFESFDFTISVDGIGNTYEYIRYPFKWNKWLERFEHFLQWLDDSKLYQKKKFGIRTATLMSAYNWLNAPFLYKYLDRYHDKYSWLETANFRCRSAYDLMLRPTESELSAKWLPPHILEEGLRLWEDTNHYQFNEFKNYVEKNSRINDVLREEKRQQLKYITTEIDQQRNQSYEMLDPLFVEWLKKE